MEPSLDALDIAQALRIPEDRRIATVAEAARALVTATQPQFFAQVCGAGAAMLVQAVLAAGSRLVVCVVPDSDEQERVVSDVGYLCPERRVLGFRAAEANPYQQAQPDRRAALSRLATLHDLAAGEPCDVLVVSAASLLRKVIPRAAVLAGSFTLRPEQELDVTEFSRRLQAVGYQRAPLVEDPGSFAVRGSLIDVWPAEADEPTRIELFGDWVMHLKAFDPETQRTAQAAARLVIPPAREAILTEGVEARAREALRTLCDDANFPSSKARAFIDELVSGRNSFGIAGYLPAFYDLETLWDYVPADATVLWIDPARALSELRSVVERAEQASTLPSGAPHYPFESLFTSEEQLDAELGKRRVGSCATGFVTGQGSGLERFLLPSEAAPSLVQSDLSDLERAVKQAHASHGKRGTLDPLVERLRVWREHSLEVTAVARTLAQARRLASLLRHREIPLRAEFVIEEAGEDVELPRPSAGAAPWLSIEVGELSRGLVAPLERRAFVTEEEIFGHRAHGSQTKKKSKARAALEDLRALSAGDFVVHVEHGVGRYLGLENRRSPGGVNLELLVVEYEGGKLFLPVYRLNQIQKWSGGERPKLDRLGGQTFAKTKARAQRRAREMADELLRLYAERHQATRPPIAAADDEFRTFEAAFPYEETPDQAAAIADVLGDLEGPTIMDRLVCGDVGFGKTEVALRAAFRVATSGRQVAVLCPTTVLAQQHYLTFSRRLADYPITIRALSRFQSKKEASETLSGLAKGSVDIVVGTHRLLSKDLQFKHLGLLVIDEEQRFGVAHKERLKQLRTSVDVLTLTATPIPRTMQLAMGGLREMSIISTAPVNRRAIRTVVSRFDDGVVKEAVERELSRGGQVFYVYNRVEGLYERAARLQQLIPGARIAVGHGQLNEATLERTMLDFVDGEYDILVATSIIESGLDIPRANTMIIDRADLFGLSQLYQLRGRVGRSQDRGYCYLLVPSPSEMNDEARSRVEALERYTELGSGFHVATLDMELRGTGDLLGADQSGPVASVGMELFCQMLEDATRELRGEEVEFDVDPELNFDIEALLPDSYISEVGIRLSFYKRLASARDEDDVQRLAQEMEDRFGEPPVEAMRFVDLMRLKVDFRRLRVLVCEAVRGSVSLRFRDDTPLDAARLAGFVATNKNKYRLTPEGRLVRRALEGEGFGTTLELADKMLGEVLPLLGV